MCLEQHIRIISEGSCDTEDWSNDAENVITAINYILRYITIIKKKYIYRIDNISQYDSLFFQH